MLMTLKIQLKIQMFTPILLPKSSSTQRQMCLKRVHICTQISFLNQTQHSSHVGSGICFHVASLNKGLCFYWVIWCVSQSDQASQVQCVLSCSARPLISLVHLLEHDSSWWLDFGLRVTCRARLRDLSIRVGGGAQHVPSFMSTHVGLSMQRR